MRTRERLTMPTEDQELPDLELEEFDPFGDHPRILLRTDSAGGASEDEADDDDLPPVDLPWEERELSINERPTIPVPPPRDSGIRLAVTRIPIVAATVDTVLCDLSKDPRSESWSEAPSDGPTRSSAETTENEPEPQNERPPSTSIVRALK